MTIADVSDKAVEQLISLAGRTAVVTGGAQGLGRAIADRLAEAGASVLIADLNAEVAQATATEIARTRSANVIGAYLDISDSRTVIAAANMATSAFGGLDIWVNNAGVFPLVPFLETEVLTLDRVLRVNLRGVFAGCQVAAEAMAASHCGGVIVNVVSVSGFVARSPGVAAYGASKHGVRGLTNQLAIELAPLGVRVLGVAPAFMTTEGTLASLPQGVRERLSSPLGRVGVPDDVARAVLFCASDMAAFMTGSTLVVDGGEIA